MFDFLAQRFNRAPKPPAINCGDCRHCSWDFERDLQFCEAPELVEYRPDGSRAISLWCADQRGPLGRCGRKARFFQAKEK